VFNQITKSFVATLLAATGLFATATFAAGSTPSVATSTGFDISYPQCGGDFPAPAGFGVVGVNDGHPLTTNPCLASELGWSESTANGTPAFYLNTDSPGPAYTSAWPTSQQTPESCSGANSPACSYDYGWNAAVLSFNNAVSAESSAGSTSPTSQAAGANWWLDVETGNHWETEESTYGATKASDTIDQQMLQGTVAYLSSVGVASIGIYSTSRQWGTITGGGETTFSKWQAWMPGYPSLSAAITACTSASFNGGRVAMIQYPSRGLDGDYVCGLLSTPTSAAISAAASSTFNEQLGVTGNVGTVSYVQTSGSPDLAVSSAGLITTDGALAKGSYVTTGTTSDTNGHSGTFTFTLSVGTITQSSTTSALATVAGSSTFSDQLAVTGNSGTVTYVQASGNPDLTVSSTGLVATDGALAEGTYSVTGATSDASGDSGTFTFILNVGTITQSAPTTDSLTTIVAATFTYQLVVTGSSEAVSYVQTSGMPNLTVSSAGLLSTDGTLTAGSYVARGSTSDASGDTGTFFYNLKVTAPSVVPVPPVVVDPVATRVIGHAVAGKTVVLSIAGAGFNGRPRITSHSGTTAMVTRDSGTKLAVRVAVKPRSRNGTFTFTITLANGNVCQVKYVQR
jgi:major membrane immunogen (membrane-anchored lipoprotein)